MSTDGGRHVEGANEGERHIRLRRVAGYGVTGKAQRLRREPGIDSREATQRKGNGGQPACASPHADRECPPSVISRH